MNLASGGRRWQLSDRISDFISDFIKTFFFIKTQEGPIIVCDRQGVFDQLGEVPAQLVFINLVASTTNHDEPLLLRGIPMLDGRGVAYGHGVVSITELLLHKLFDQPHISTTSVTTCTANVHHILHVKQHRFHVLDRSDGLPTYISIRIIKSHAVPKLAPRPTRKAAAIDINTSHRQRAHSVALRALEGRFKKVSSKDIICEV